MLSFTNIPVDHPSKASIDKLVNMASQIVMFFRTRDSDTASAKIVEHINKFWGLRMRRAIVAHPDAGGASLNPVVRRAIELLRQQTSSSG